MASTYSALKIQLMTTGENSGTWGNVTNLNLGTALEEAIVGSADVTFASTTVTLTLTDTNSSQTARNLRLNLTGTSGGAQNLIVPSIEKVYIVNNGCADTITVKNSGGTGIAVPAGKTMYVYNDGTNVVDAITHLTSLTLGSALPIASGGTGSNSATFSGANITSLNATAVSSGTLDNARTSASSSNGASTIVARDGSGNFTANVGTFTTISGAGGSVTAINASNISTGTIANARTTAASANGASTIVARDASGNFSAGTITAALSGNATTASTASATSAALTAGTGLSSAGTFNGSTARTFAVSYGTTAGTACQGNDARLSDSRQATNTNTQLASLGVGTAASGTAGEIRATNNITAYFSDERLKTKTGDIENALDKVCQIETMLYHANETAVALGYDASIQEVGVTAQSVQKVQPEIVVPAPIDDRYLTVRYEKLVPLLIEAIKELKAQVAELKAK
jgi:hypothetical protein